MELNKFNNTLLYSNKNVEKVAKKIVNESTNAVVMEMFEDKCILADHTTGQIFEANYSFDGKTFEFKNFSEVELESDNSSLKETISDFFDDKSVNLAEEYEKTSGCSYDVFENSLTEAIASKNISKVINYQDLKGINEEIDELKETSLYKLFEERLENYPSSTIKMFDWVNPVKVAVIDEDYEKVINKSVARKAKTLKSNIEFKKELAEAAEAALNGNSYLLEDLINENISILALDKPALKELVGLSVIGNKELMENRNSIIDAINTIVEADEKLSDKKEDLEGSEGSEGSEDDTPEASEKDIEALKKALEGALEKAKDEKLKEKIEGLIKSIDEASKSGETDVGSIKESISLLKL